MRARRIATVTVLALAFFGATVVTGTEPGHQGRLLEYTGARAYSLRVRIERAPSEEPGHCDGFGVADLRVAVRGERIEGPAMLTIDRERIPTVHALLMDTSGSIRGYRPEIVAAASGHVERLETRHERAMVVSFDETVLLHQAVTDTRNLLLSGIERARISSGTAFHDGLYYTLRELAAYPDRPVVVLLTDGVDTTSLHDREDVMRLVRGQPELTIFCIGFNLPPLVGAGPPGLLSTRKFLQRLASTTNGKFFDAPTGSRLDRVYRRIRELLDNEATLTVIDPRPDLEPARVRVGSRRPGCSVEVFRARSKPPDDDEESGVPYDEALRADRAYRAPYLGRGNRVADSACPLAEDASPRWFAEVRDGRIVGCALDVTLDYGLLYDPLQPGWTYLNEWMGLKTRHFEIDVPAPGQLPCEPAELVDRLAGIALRARDADLELGRFPARHHARPYYDHPALFHGRVFFDLRGRLARVLHEVPEYRSWLNGRLRDETARELAELEHGLRRRVPDISEEGLRVVMAESEAARAIRERAATLSEASLQRYLGAWLGDVTAHELFTRWEALRIDRLLSDVPAPNGFRESWRELRRLVELPSYTGVLTLLGLGRSPEGDRIGLWRIVLPRPGWLQVRTRGYRHDLDFADLPLDLVPDEPLGYWLIGELPVIRPELAADLFSGGYRVRSVEYELLGKPHTHAPRKAFRRTRVSVSLENGSKRTALVADMRLEGNEPSVDALQVETGEGRFDR